MTNTTSDANLSAFYKAALGEKNQPYYLDKFTQFDAKVTGLEPSWNWAACIGFAGWALYRKMYGSFFALLAIQVALGAAFKIHPAFGLVDVVLWLGFTVFANSLYHKKIAKQIIQAKQSNEGASAVIQHLSKRGGVHTWVPYVIGILLLLLIIPVVILTYTNTATRDTGTNKTTSQVTKESTKPIELPAASSNGIKKQEEAVRANPEDAVAWSNLGVTYYDTKQHPQAINAYQQALRINPEDATAWYILGNTYRDTKQYLQAINAFQQALRINPEHADAWNNLGITYYDTKQHPQAINAYQQALRINPEHANAWNNLGLNYAETKQYPQAINAYQQALRINPEHAVVWDNFGRTYYLTGERAKMMDVYKKLRALDPAQADEFFNALILPGG